MCLFKWAAYYHPSKRCFTLEQLPLPFLSGGHNPLKNNWTKAQTVGRCWTRSQRGENCPHFIEFELLLLFASSSMLSLFHWILIFQHVGKGWLPTGVINSEISRWASFHVRALFSNWSCLLEGKCMGACFRFYFLFLVTFPRFCGNV